MHALCTAATAALLAHSAAGQVFRTFYPLPGGPWTQDKWAFEPSRRNDQYTRGLAIATGSEPGENGWSIPGSESELEEFVSELPAAIHQTISEWGYSFIGSGEFADGTYSQAETYLCQAMGSILYRPIFFHQQGKGAMEDSYFLRQCDIARMGMNTLGGFPKDSVALCMDRLREIKNVPRGAQGACLVYKDGVPSAKFLRTEKFNAKVSTLNLEMLRNGATDSKTWQGLGAGSFEVSDSAWAGSVRPPDGSAAYDCRHPRVNDDWSQAAESKPQNEKGPEPEAEKAMGVEAEPDSGDSESGEPGSGDVEKAEPDGDVVKPEPEEEMEPAPSTSPAVKAGGILKKKRMGKKFQRKGGKRRKGGRRRFRKRFQKKRTTN